MSGKVSAYSHPFTVNTHWTPVYDSLAYILPRALPTYFQQGWLNGDASSPLRTFQEGRTPFSTPIQVFGTGALYLTIVLGGREVMQRFKVPPQQLKTLFLFHNIALSLSSGLLLALMLEEILPVWYHQGFHSAICAESSWTPRMEFFYIINYMFKFWELIDTVFLVLKKKPLLFLHVYHHSATALLCFSQLLGKTSVSWVVITLNLLVHVVMYMYYALTTLRIRVPWKRAVTTMQILQFIIDLGIVYYASYNYFVGAYKLPLPGKGHCAAGKEHAVFSGCAILTSYLFLFIAFYKNTYKNKSNASAKSANISSSMGEKTPSNEIASSTGVRTRQQTSTPQLEKARPL